MSNDTTAVFTNSSATAVTAASIYLDPKSAEGKALKGYTEWDYEEINAELRSGDVSEESMEQIELIKDALDKIPSHQGTVLRGTSFKFFEWYTIAEGQVISDPAFFSTSINLATAEKFAKCANIDDDLDGDGVILEIECKQQGKYLNLGGVGSHKDEEEVLFPTSTKFKITKFQKVDKRKCGHIWMEEVVDMDMNVDVEDSHDVYGNDSTVAQAAMESAVAPSKKTTAAAADGGGEEEDLKDSTVVDTSVKTAMESTAVSPSKKTAEVLFPPATKFLITKVEKGKEDEVDQVCMTELVDEPSNTDVVGDAAETEAPVEVPATVETSAMAAVLSTNNRLGVTASHDSGSVWVNGVRRSARHQPKMGSVFVNGLRRSARLLATSS
jgi:hypothetical protein